MPVIQACVFTWRHEGRCETLFLELSDQYRIHFLRYTRSRRLAWGSIGTWRLFMLHDGLVLQLSNFQCTIGARVRNIEFRTAPANPGRMFDDTGRSIQYLGMLYMSWETTSTRALSLTGPEAEDPQWVIL